MICQEGDSQGPNFNLQNEAGRNISDDPHFGSMSSKSPKFSLFSFWETFLAKHCFLDTEIRNTFL